jgi:hypothetical protein
MTGLGRHGFSIGVEMTGIATLLPLRNALSQLEQNRGIFKEPAGCGTEAHCFHKRPYSERPQQERSGDAVSFTGYRKNREGLKDANLYSQVPEGI